MGDDVGGARILVLADPDTLANQAAAAVAEELQVSIRARKRALFVLAGGSTPRGVYERLASAGAAAPWWSAVEFLFGDERCVPPDDEASNYRMVRESLLDPLGIAAERVHRIRGELAPAEAAAAYERELVELMGSETPQLDLLLLGLGEDGHTASLFPGSTSLEETTRWVVASRSPVAPHDRVTLTLALLGRARRVFFLATGRAKAAAVGAVLGSTSPQDLPATRVRALEGKPTWWLDRAAAANL